MRLAEAPFSPLRLGHSVLRPFEFEAGRKDLDLRLEADPALPDHLLGDAARIKQVLRNLIGNAFKFTESGGVTLRILADREGERPGIRRLRFEVVDTGIGVPEGSREWIFQPFAQGDASTARKYDGVGLGLFISKQIVESMGGEIGLRPGAGGGSVFHFSLPLPGSAITFPGIAETGPGSAAGFAPSGTQAGPRTGPETEESTGTLPPEARRLRILAVDDHPLNLKVMESFLNAYGLSVDLAKSGESALEACARAAYHVIFMDCHMPGMDGYECTRRLRESGAARPATIIGVTADALENNLGRCLDAGMDALLIKPIMEPELRAKLAECALRLPRQGEAHG
jgi:CheY-like chemotaxis protein